MKKLMGILLAASMVFSLAACGSTADTAASSAAGTTATAEGSSSNNQAPDVKVGAIILGDETEGYSAAHINGIKEAAAELGMSDDQIVWKYKIAEGGVTADAAEDLVGQGCNLIISNSYGHQTYMEEEAEKHPDVNFVAMTGDFAAISRLDNLQRLHRRLPEPLCLRCRRRHEGQGAGRVRHPDPRDPARQLHR